MYNAIFGQNPAAGALLACLGLTRDDVGRFRDVWLTDKHIAVYTRNGGGNRVCWHEDSQKYGSPQCKHHEVIEQEEERLEMTDEEIQAHGYRKGNTTICYADGVKHSCYTGRIVPVTYYFCENPDSEDCRCVGCFMRYHVHKLPHYSHDCDDEDDCTYATIYFHFPPEYAEQLKGLADKESMSGDERWAHFFERLAQLVTPKGTEVTE